MTPATNRQRSGCANRQSGGPGGFGRTGDDADSRFEGSQMSKTAAAGSGKRWSGVKWPERIEKEDGENRDLGGLGSKGKREKKDPVK